VKAQPKGQNRFGEILAASLEVHGQLQKVSISTVAGKDVVRLGEYNLKLSFDYDWYDDNNFDAWNEHV
jgi:hypothetical protein